MANNNLFHIFSLSWDSHLLMLLCFPLINYCQGQEADVVESYIKAKKSISASLPKVASLQSLFIKT